MSITEEGKKLSPTEAFHLNPLVASLKALVQAKKSGLKVRKASPFGLSLEEYPHVWSIDGRYFYCKDDIEVVRKELSNVSKKY